MGKLILSDEGEKKMNLVQITDYNFDPEVLKCDIPVLACFQAEWSAPAKKLGAILTEIANEYAGRIKVALLNIDANPTVTSAYTVLKIPTVILLKHGQVLARLEDDFSKETILAQVIPSLDE